MPTLELPQRRTPPPQTTGDSIPHMQKSQLGPQNLIDELYGWAFSKLPNVSEQKSIMSFDSTRALWLDDSVKAAHDDGFSPRSSREFAHIHIDGSMHLSLSRESAAELVEKRWGEPHPVQKMGENVWMVYSPRDPGELEVCKRILADSYYYASGTMIAYGERPS